MKSVLCALGLALSAAAFGSVMSAPREVPAPVSKIYIPEGFDNNDNTEAVLFGEFPDSCHRVGQSGFRINHSKREVVVWATAFDHSRSGVVCNEVMTPFLQKVSLGVLPDGNYKVVLRKQPEVQSELHVSKSRTAQPDDFNYAPVDAAYVAHKQNEASALHLVGRFPMLLKGCMEIKEVRVYRNPADVLVVLPIAEITEPATSEGCRLDYKYQVSLGGNDFATKSLLHVRVSNGNSLNQIVYPK